MADVGFVAVDLGAESGRVLVGALRDRQFRLEVVHRFPNGPVRIGESMFWDVLLLWSEVKRGLMQARRQYKDALVSIGIDTWGVDFALLDRQDILIGNPFHYRDKRTEGMMEEAFRRVPREEIYRATGIQFMRLNTLYQLLSMVVSQSPHLSIAERMLMMPDLFHFWLSGEKYCEFTDATTTQFYDPVKGDWAYEMLERMGVETRILGPIVPAGTVLGSIRKTVAEELDLPPDFKVVAPGSHDTASAVAAVPLSGPDCAYISSGTWSLVGAEVTSPVITDQSLAFNFTNEGGVYGTFRLLRNVMGLWLLQECRRVWSRAGKEYSYDQLLHLAQEVPPFRSVVVPDDPRFLAPENMLTAIQEFCRETGQAEPVAEGEFIRACLEGLALTYRWVIDRLETLLGKKVSTIHIVGGGSQNWLLNQWTADATGKPVVAGPVEATATGNALVQAIALGYLTSHQELRSVVSSSFPTQVFEPSGDGRWDEVYEKWQKWLPPL